IALANEFSDVDRGVHIGRQRVSKVRIEIGESRTVDDQIKFGTQPGGNLSIDPESWLSDVAFDHLDLVVDELQQLRSIFLVKRIEYRRIFNQFLKALLRGVGLLAADQ